MYTDFYERISAPFRRSERATAALFVLNKLLVWATAAAFLGLAAWLALHQDARIIRYLAVCALSFAGATALRSALNRPRPYEVYDLPPLLHKETQGKSFPSRHVFSICVIGTSLLYILPPLGAALLVLGALLAVARVVSGVHFVRDVVSGAVIGVLSAVIGFSI